ncbi:MAG: ATP-binding protein [Paludibacter sp.]|nr:ATP-binding protein [Paludibacter sp.]
MIQELKITNFLSFKEEVTFSFEATKDTTFEDYQIVEVAPGVRLLRFAMIYGANASGKSNLLYAIQFLRDFWFDVKKNINDETETVPFKLDKATPTQPSVFSLKFYVEGVKYWYYLELDEHKVINEKLYFYNSVQPTLLFDRGVESNISVVNFNSSVVKISSVAKEEINIKCLPNMSFFAARNQVNVLLPRIDAARDWMKQQTLPVIAPKTNMFEFAEEEIQKNKKLKSYILEFIKEADFNITAIDTRIEKQNIPPEFIDVFLKSEKISEDQKEQLRTDNSLTNIRTDFEHTVINDRGVEKYIISEGLQSDGTRQITGLEAGIFTALQKDALLIVDEIEASLHPQLVFYVLKNFLEQKGNRAQLLITTHYDPLLNEVDELFRKDSVWFTEKNQAGATELYSLVEFSGLNRISSLQKAYRQGRFGAIPQINL